MSSSLGAPLAPPQLWLIKISNSTLCQLRRWWGWRQRPCRPCPPSQTPSSAPSANLSSRDQPGMQNGQHWMLPSMQLIFHTMGFYIIVRNVLCLCQVRLGQAPGMHKLQLKMIIMTVIMTIVVIVQYIQHDYDVNLFLQPTAIDDWQSRVDTAEVIVITMIVIQ